jgi:6-phosphogluconate dehydrogenase
VAALRKPRAIILLVMAGKPVDETIAVLSEFMEVRWARDAQPTELTCNNVLSSQPGDLLIDGGNEWYPNTIR